MKSLQKLSLVLLVSFSLAACGGSTDVESGDSNKPAAAKAKPATHDDEAHGDDDANPMADVAIEAAEVADGIFMLTGNGGNIGLSIGDDATFIIDDQYAPLSKKITAAIGELTDRPVDYVLNTHWHFDHVGGNENFGTDGAVIFAHTNVRKRMAAGQEIKAFNVVVEPAPAVALPVVTFNDTLALHLNGQTIRGIHVPKAHTDGDTIIYFEQANVLHLGDVFFNGMYPFIDSSSGGSVDGVIAAVNNALAIGNAETKIIPGHGPLAGKQDLRDYRDMLIAVRENIATLMAQGKTLDEIQAAKPTSAFDATANRIDFLTPEQFVGLVYGSLAAK